MRPLKWTELRDICREHGWTFDRQRGDHYTMVKPGAPRPVVIPQYRDLKEDIVLGVLKTIGLTKRELLKRLNPSRAKKAKA